MTRPLVALVSQGTLPPPLAAMVRHLAGACVVAAYEPTVRQAFAAALVSDPTLLDRIPHRLPCAVWTTDPEMGALLATNTAVVAVVTSDDRTVTAASDKGIYVPIEPTSFEGVRPMPPHVRARLRRIRGLPVRAIGEVDVLGSGVRWCGEEVPSEMVNTVLGCASVVALRGAVLVRALAWGAPCVTDDESAARVGAAAGEDVEVAATGDLVATAVSVADDPHKAAHLSRRARDLYERRFDMRQTALRVANRLGVLDRCAGRLDVLMDEMGTPTDAESRRRCHELLLPVSG